jgi:transposase
MVDRALPETDRHWLKVLDTMNEAQARLYVAQRAIELGRGGISQLARVTGMSRPTIMKGVAELRSRRPLGLKEGRIRRAGAGRPRALAAQPGLEGGLKAILEETTAGDPMSPLKWTCKSTQSIADELRAEGVAVSADTVGRCLREMGYSLQANVKSVEGAQHPDRDGQFRYINKQVKRFLREGMPTVSVDTKKKELVGGFRNAGRAWHPAGQAPRVNVHDFPHLGHGKAVPYGTYDIGKDEGLVNVGISHDTAEFAVASIRRWWKAMGRRAYPAATRLLICADAGGSNGPKLRAWKAHLQRFAREYGLDITVCHYPPGTSKWNKVEHRLFSFISMNWRGRPLVNFETVVNLIASTRTRTGLRVKALLDRGTYEKGEEIADAEMEQLALKRHAFHPDWNYTLAAI